MKPTEDKKLKVGLLLDSVLIPTWAYEMIKIILIEGYADISLSIVNNSPKSSGKKSSTLYKAFRRLDRKFFGTNRDAFQRININSLQELNAEVLSVTPIQNKFSDTFTPEDVIKVASYQLDILIRLGFRIIKGDILRVPKLGIWSYHHGDNMTHKGGPPCFWEVMNGDETTGSVLQILSEKLDDGKVIYRSWSRTDPLSVDRNSQKVYWKSLHFIPRQIKRINEIGEEKWEKEVKKYEVSEGIEKSILYTPPGNLETISLVKNLMTKNTLRKKNEKLNHGEWTLWIFSNNDTINEAISIKNPPLKYWADPFIIEEEGKCYIFFEEYDFTQKKAAIGVGEWTGSVIQNSTLIIKENFHLSYPFVFNAKDQWWLVPEAAEVDGLHFYNADSFPYHWTLHHVVMKEFKFYDPTIIYKDKKYWLFANMKAHPEASSFDELFLFYTNDLELEEWNPHPMNPIVSDVRSSRPAGKLFEKDGIWYRPAQDSGKRYGHRIRIQKILHWDELVYDEETEYLIEPNWCPNLLGTHTYNFSENWTVLDSFSQ